MAWIEPLSRFPTHICRRALDVTKHALAHTWADGFIHAGNLAYLSLLTLFPFFIVVAAIFGTLGRSQDGLNAVAAFLKTLPPDVAKLLAGPIHDVLAQRGGNLLTFSILVGLWSTASFVETMRDIIRRSYDVRAKRPIWQYRLGSMALIIGSVLLMAFAFAFQVALTAVEQFVINVLPGADRVLGLISLSRIAPVVALFTALYILFVTLTPQRFRKRCPKWPGAALTTAIWVVTTMLLPCVLRLLGSYNLTYGSLAGVIIALLFFFIVGLGFVLGAELNAALAVVPKIGQKSAESETR